MKDFVLLAPQKSKAMLVLASHGHLQYCKCGQHCGNVCKLHSISVHLEKLQLLTVPGAGVTRDAEAT